jgi:Zn-dependent peptidase ImmA (M78 family)
MAPDYGCTDRAQKLQRAFAAEFLCPIDSLRSYLGDEFLPDAFEDAAEYFGISETAVKSHLANHQLIQRTCPWRITNLWHNYWG